MNTQAEAVATAQSHEQTSNDLQTEPNTDRAEQVEIVFDDSYHRPIEERIARLILHCVADLDARYGRNKIAKVLKGTNAQFIFDHDHTNAPYFGTLDRFHVREVVSMIDGLVLDGHLDFDGEEYPVLTLTPSARAALEANEPVAVQLPWSLAPRPPAQKIDRALIEALRRMRTCTSKEEDIPPYMVFNNRTLIDLAEKAPQNEEELYQVVGLGEKRIRRYGDTILTAIEAGIGEPLPACMDVE